jgi:hypothetical protein
MFSFDFGLPDVLTGDCPSSGLPLPSLDGAVGAVGVVGGMVGGAEGIGELAFPAGGAVPPPLLGAPGAGAGAGDTTGAGVGSGKFFSAHPLGMRPIGNIHVAVNITPYPIAGTN